ncbi:FAD dependent oxidoreductase [Corynascus novoguineensis]|uniref:FAD dependent oxidoreductase n=1 Tax=Corynascus novoguineensis TaxID=1126955 RepID=A0AAN7CR34_9PEZI|nr:FAD dependent oxidoreductase [Corynascus novoguineensis]
MGNITIFGAGITGLSTATVLSQANPSHKITIVARDLPGDAPSQSWASPWACAGWVGLGGSPREQAMQLAALEHLRTLAAAEHGDDGPGVRRVELTDCFPAGVRALDDSPGAVWYRGRVPEFEVVEEGGEADGEGGGAVVRYGSVVVTPAVFLVWLRRQLEEAGVQFVRVEEVKALGELAYLGHDVLVNASGLASLALEDVKDDQVVMDRTWVTVVRSEYQDAFVRRGNGVYTYIFGRGDGTAVVGGVSEPVTDKMKSKEEVHEDLFRRAHENLPQHFPSAAAADYDIFEDLVGIRPLRPAGVRVEKERIAGQKVVHAYGTTIGGYIHSFGLAKEVARLVEESL